MTDITIAAHITAHTAADRRAADRQGTMNRLTEAAAQEEAPLTGRTVQAVDTTDRLEV